MGSRFGVLAALLALCAIAGCAGTPGTRPDGGLSEVPLYHGEWPMPGRVVRARPFQDGPAQPAPPPFAYAYLPPRSPELQRIHERVRDADLLRRLPEVQAIDGMFALPRRLRFVTAECGEFGAFYRPA